MTSTPPSARMPRVPVLVPVETTLPVGSSWSLNISETGMAIAASSPDLDVDSPVGERFEATLTLPGRVRPLHVICRVAWAHTRQPAERLVLGASFVDLTADTRLELRAYVEAYRPAVVLALPPAGLVDRCVAELGSEMHVHPAGSPEALEAVLGRGDVSVVAVFGEPAAAIRLVDGMTREGGAGPWHARDALATAPSIPRLLFCAPAPDEVLLRLHNENRIHRSLSAPFDGRALAKAIREAASEHAVHSGMRAAGAELEGQRARRAEVVRAALSGSEQRKLVYASPAMREVMDMIDIAAAHSTPVLLMGETGTGKELLARLIHDLGERAAGPFVTQDCGALTETLLEAELFGHVKGAFTGAVSSHAGLFATAEGGTIFLDEVENTSPTLQAKLLRVLETGEVRPVGGALPRKVDVRVVAASNRDLKRAVDQGELRADLYYRLARFPIEVPPLRERREDILPIAESFVDWFAEELGRDAPGMSPEAKAALLSHGWPGNVRELRNVIERAMLLGGRRSRIETDVLGNELDGLHRVGERARLEPGADDRPLKERVQAYERALIAEALERSGGVLGKAARELRTNAVTLGRKARQYGLWKS